jgi:rod shape determining protein RodA
MVIGIIPVVGVPLPLISQGGTSIVVHLLAFGVILSTKKT